EVDTSVSDLPRKMCSRWRDATPCPKWYSTYGFSDDCGFYRFCRQTPKLPSLPFNPLRIRNKSHAKSRLLRNPRTASLGSAFPLFSWCLLGLRGMSAKKPAVPSTSEAFPQVPGGVQLMTTSSPVATRRISFRQTARGSLSNQSDSSTSFSLQWKYSR